jgi:hypothetical protein
VNGSFYARISTYSDSAYSVPIDTGTVAAAIVPTVSVSADVQETLVFCVGITVTVGCGSVGSGTVALTPDPMSVSAASTGTA